MNVTFLELFRKYIEYYSKTTNVLEARKVGTIRTYNAKYSLVSSYLYEKSAIKLMATDFNIRFAREFLGFLTEKYSHNHAVRVIEICKSVLNFGANNEIIKIHPLNFLTLKRVGAGKPVSLTPEEVLKLENYISLKHLEIKARDMFLFQCYTGMDFGDISSVSEKNIITFNGRSYISKNREKTGVESIIPYFPNAEALFKKYNYNMKLLTNQVYNRTLKDIGQALIINKHLTTHVGRKTYAMIKLNHESYSIGAVSKMLGHSSIKTTETYYAQVSINLIDKEMNRLGF